MATQFQPALSPCSSSSSLASSLFAFPPRHRHLSVSASDSESLSSGYESSFSNTECEDTSHDDESLSWKCFCDHSKSSAVPLIPGLTDDVALLCLSRVPLPQRFRLASVSRLWRKIIYSDSMYNLRRTHNSLQNTLCIFFLSQGRELQLVLKAFNMCTQEWFKLPSLGLGCSGEFYDLWDLQLVSIGSRLFAIGGTIRERGTSIISAVRHDIWQLDLITCSWQPGPPIAVYGRRIVAAGDSDAELIFVAASNEPQEAGSEPSLSLLCTTTGEWIPVPAMPSLPRRRYLHGATCYKSLFYLFLIDPDSGAQWGEVYNPADATWSHVEGLPTRKSVVVAGGELLTVENGPLHKGKSLCIERYNCRDNAWEAMSKLTPGFVGSGQARASVASCFLAGLPNALCVLKTWQEQVTESHWDQIATLSLVSLNPLHEVVDADRDHGKLHRGGGSMSRRWTPNSILNDEVHMTRDVPGRIQSGGTAASPVLDPHREVTSPCANSLCLDDLGFRNIQMNGFDAAAAAPENPLDQGASTQSQWIEDGTFRHLVIQTQGEECVGCSVIAI